MPYKKQVYSFLLLLFIAYQAKAVNIIRDEEIEQVLFRISSPIFRAAKLPAEQVKIFIITDPEINAFTNGGNNIFIHTGLIQACEKSSMLAAVIAHETGHIAGGHVLQMDRMMDKSYKQLIFPMITALAAMAAGNPDVGSAVMIGGTEAIYKSIKSYSRVNEERADRSALQYLQKSEVNPEGMIAILSKLASLERGVGEANIYTRTHPFSQDRLSKVRDFLLGNNYNYNKMDELEAAYTRANIKLKAFTDPDPRKALGKYNKTDSNSLYAKAILLYRNKQFQEAEKVMNILIEREPSNANFYELKGQIEFDNNKITKAIISYQKAVALNNKSALFKAELANLLLVATENKSISFESYKNEIAENLQAARFLEPEDYYIILLQARYASLNKERALADFYLAEAAYISGDYKKAKHFANRAKKETANQQLTTKINELLEAIEE